MRKEYEALLVPILNLSDKPDLEGHIIDTDCLIEYGKRVPVIFNGSLDVEDQVGWASIRRVGTRLLADMKLVSTMPEHWKSLDLMKKLTPGIGFEVLQRHGNMMIEIKVRDISLTPAGNIDPTIEPLGDKVKPLTKRTVN